MQPPRPGRQGALMTIQGFSEPDSKLAREQKKNQLTAVSRRRSNKQAKQQREHPLPVCSQLVAQQPHNSCGSFHVSSSLFSLFLVFLFSRSHKSGRGELFSRPYFIHSFIYFQASKRSGCTWPQVPRFSAFGWERQAVGGPRPQPRGPSGCGSYQSGEEGDSQVPEVLVQQAAVHHVPEDGDAS